MSYTIARIPIESLVIGAACLFAIMVATGGEASAADPAAPSASRPVYFGDLDLRDEEDLARLENRVERTAFQLCRRLSTAISSRRSLERCAEEAARRARPQIEAAANGAARGR